MSYDSTSVIILNISNVNVIYLQIISIFIIGNESWDPLRELDLLNTMS